MIYKFRDLETHQALPVPPGDFTIGRDDSCQIMLDNQSVSRRHARLVNSDQGLLVEDLGSSNGTAVRGQLINAPTSLQVGDLVQFGTACYRLDPELPGEVTPTPAGLKPVGRRSANFHKATDRVPLLGIIHFEDPQEREGAPLPPSTAPTISPVSRPPLTHPATKNPQAPADSTPQGKDTTPPAPPWGLTLTLAFGAGVAVGIFTGIAIAQYLFKLAQGVIK